MVLTKNIKHWLEDKKLFKENRPVMLNNKNNNDALACMAQCRGLKVPGSIPAKGCRFPVPSWD